MMAISLDCSSIKRRFAAERPSTITKQKPNKNNNLQLVRTLASLLVVVLVVNLRHEVKAAGSSLHLPHSRHAWRGLM